MAQHSIRTLFAFGGLFLASVVGADPYTPKHEAGRCAIRGQCGSKYFFGKELPCVDNGLAEEPDDDLRQQIVDLCGEKWSSGPVCCDADQVCSSTRVIYTSLTTFSSANKWPGLY